LISSLTLLEAGGVHGNGVVTSRSADGGLTWSTPFQTATGADRDKNWIVCDNSTTSPFNGHCYTEWDDHGAGNLLQMSTSIDGGRTWSAPPTNNTGVIGGQPVVEPNGTVIVPIDNANETAVGAFNSTDGGVSWSAWSATTSPRRMARMRWLTGSSALRRRRQPVRRQVALPADSTTVSLRSTPSRLAWRSAMPSSADDAVLFAGNGGSGAASLWNLVDNNGSKHRDQGFPLIGVVGATPVRQRRDYLDGQGLFEFSAEFTHRSKRCKCIIIP